MKKLFLIILVAICFTNINTSYAEQIFTTLGQSSDGIIFDGKWTFLKEWKPTSENRVGFNDGSELVIKTGHDHDNLYVLLDSISEHSIAKFADFGIVCIDSNFGKENYPQKDDYCFIVSLGSKNPITLEGGSTLGKTNHFTKIKNHPDLIAVGGISDKNDRYTPIPHTTYEFKIPIEVFGASDMYGFYVAVYDANANKIYSWPQDVTTETFPHVPSPSKWGELISPDKSLPEFQWPLITLLPAILLVVCLTRKIQITFYSKTYKK